GRRASAGAPRKRGLRPRRPIRPSRAALWSHSSSNPSATSWLRASIAGSASGPSARRVISVPREAPSRSSPRMLLPSSPREPRATLMLAVNCDASRTNRAAARACSPSGLTIRTVRVAISLPIDVGPHQVGGHADGLARVLAHLTGHAQQTEVVRIEARQLDEHRQVDAGDDLHLLVLEK